MKIISFGDTRINDRTCMTIGSFDGLHIVHKFLIDITIQISKTLSLKSVIFTFIEHPHLDYDLILTKDEKLDFLKDFDVDYIVLLDRSAMSIKKEEFMEILSKNFNVSWIVIGYNHRFGNNREGDSLYLTQNVSNFRYGLTIVPPIQYEGIDVSSSNIRKLIRDGNVELANKLLTYNFFLKGKIVRGKGIGKELGFPTANLIADPQKILPKRGVYLTKTYIDGLVYNSATYIGDVIETYIFDFEEDIYDKHIKIEFIKRISDDVPFKDFESLKKKIENDINLAKEALNSILLREQLQ